MARPMMKVAIAISMNAGMVSVSIDKVYYK